MDDKKKNENIISWILRVFKGAFIGAAFILPGLSGGAFAVVFGLYERLIKFLADVTKDFKDNFMFFLPVGIGGVGGIFLFSVLLKFLFKEMEIQLIWFFIGCIIGTLPALWNQAGEKGRSARHYVTLGVSFFASLGLLILLKLLAATGGDVELYVWAWPGVGALIAFGAIIPGLSTSTLLMFLGFFEPMVRSIAELDFIVILLIGLGGLATIFAFSKFVNLIFTKAYGIFFHCIIGFVLSSTVLLPLLIIPEDVIKKKPELYADFTYLGFDGVMCAAAAVIGLVLALALMGLERKFNHAGEGKGKKKA
jgi:putative membrane protein